MLLKCGKSDDEIKAIQEANKAAEWHDWFAWYPIALYDGTGRCAWLSTIKRKRQIYPSVYSTDGYWEYKL